MSGDNWKYPETKKINSGDNIQGLTVGGNVKGLTVGENVKGLTTGTFGGPMSDYQSGLANTYIEPYIHRPDPYQPWHPCGCGYGWPCGCQGKTTIGSTSLLKTLVTQAEPTLSFKLTDNKHTLVVLLAGYDKKDVNLKVSDNKLLIKAKNGGLDGKETFEKTVILPSTANLNTVLVTLEKGVLKIQMDTITPPVLTIEIQ